MNKSIKSKLAAIAAASAGVAAAGSATAAPIVFDSSEIITNIGAGEGFALVAGMAMIGFVATMSVLRKSRGAVR